jgi:tetratricopeptide (TPR) repeat protein
MRSIRWLLFLLMALSLHTVTAQDTITMAAADTLWSQGEVKAAKKLYDKVIEAGDAPVMAYVRRSQCNYKLGADWEVIFADLNEALRRDPHHFSAWYTRGRRYYDGLMFERALEDFSEAIKYAPDPASLADCYIGRANSRMALRAFERAIEDLNHALELDSAEHAPYSNLAHALNETGRPDEALRRVMRYIELEPNDHTGYMNAGFYLAQAERYDEALAMYNKAWERAGNDVALVLNNRGYVKYKLQDLDGALKDIKKSLELKSWNSYAYRNLALVRIAQGKNEEACTALEDALKWGFTKQYGEEVQQLHNEHCK